MIKKAEKNLPLLKNPSFSRSH